MRLALVPSMAALLIAALVVPNAFGDQALEFALAYGVVRAAHIALFALASRDDPSLGHSVAALATSTAAGVGLLIGGALLGGAGQAVLWVLALLLDMGAPYFFGAEGWKLVPAHFAERHGLVIIVALGESIVASGRRDRCRPHIRRDGNGGAGDRAGLRALVDLLRCRRDRERVEVGPRAGGPRAQRTCSRRLLLSPLSARHRDSPRRLGPSQTLAHSDDPLETVPAFALLGGVAIYLLGHVAVRLRGAHTLNRQRLALALVLFALIPAALEVPALATLGAVTALLSAMIAYETRNYGEGRGRVRHEYAVEGATSQYSPR